MLMATLFSHEYRDILVFPGITWAGLVMATLTYYTFSFSIRSTQVPYVSEIQGELWRALPCIVDLKVPTTQRCGKNLDDTMGWMFLEAAELC